MKQIVNKLIDDFEHELTDIEKCYKALDKVKKDPLLMKRALTESGIYYIGKDGKLKLTVEYGGKGDE